MKRKAALAAVLAVILLLLITEPWLQKDTAYRLPVLVYHHFDAASDHSTTVTAERFREQMTALKTAGYTTVTPADVLEFVDSGTPLPPKSVMITMDDGYTSNVTVAAPILEELGFCATVFVIGVDEGQIIDIHTGNPLYPARFSYEEALPWLEKGVLEFQSHSYDMHQSSYGDSTVRDGILPMAGESLSDYRAALRDDLMRLSRQRSDHGLTSPLIAMAYPFGFFSGESEAVLREAGIRLTFTTIERANLLRVGDEDCLWNLGRFNITERCSGKALVRRLGRI